MIYNVYCDESCHLEHDGINVMVLGAVWCPQKNLREITQQINQIKMKNGVNRTMELKWTKISPAKIDLYQDVIDYFFDNDSLHFRAIIIPDKSKLNHARFSQTHDEWYYKMYFDMLKVIFNPTDNYEVYIDIKDTHSYQRAQKLREICCNSMYDFSAEIIRRLQPVRSEEVQLMQFVDILIGAIGYKNRIFFEGFEKSIAKQHVIEIIKNRSGHSLSKTTLLREEKVNLLVWDARSAV